MDTSSYDERITAQEAVIAALQPDAEAALEAFKQSTAQWAAECYKRDVETAVKDFPDQINALGPDGVRQLKQDLAELIGRAPNIVEEQFSDVEFPHSKPPRAMYDWQLRGSSKHLPLLEEPVRRIRGASGPLLSSRGLLSAHQGEGWRGDRYPWSLDWPQQVIVTASEYVRVLEAIDAAQDLGDTAERQRSEAQAADLWRNT